MNASMDKSKPNSAAGTFQDDMAQEIRSHDYGDGSQKALDHFLPKT